MVSAKIFFISAFLLVGFQEIQGHGKLMDPISRSSAWRSGLSLRRNYNDNENFCGGTWVQQSNGGKCGACGDNYRDPQPRKNENGGFYGNGKIVKSYKQGEKITVTVNINANHMGYFEFAVCPLSGPKDIETEECFEKYPVKLADGGYKYPLKSGVTGDYIVDVILPEGLTCEHCSFRWHYKGGNNWGVCEDGTGKLGCGPQETFRGCSDISIV